MHTPADQPRASIYYNYQVFDAWLPSQHRADPEALKRRDIVIAGAGPAALTTALEIARHGVKVTVLAAERQVSEGSRAIVFTRRSMEFCSRWVWRKRSRKQVCLGVLATRFTAGNWCFACRPRMMRTTASSP